MFDIAIGTGAFSEATRESWIVGFRIVTYQFDILSEFYFKKWTLQQAIGVNKQQGLASTSKWILEKTVVEKVQIPITIQGSAYENGGCHFDVVEEQVMGGCQ